MFTKVFFGVLGSDHVNGPGYVRVQVECENESEAEIIARRRINDATGGLWCGPYESLEEINQDDRIFRGEA